MFRGEQPAFFEQRPFHFVKETMLDMLMDLINKVESDPIDQNNNEQESLKRSLNNILNRPNLNLGYVYQNLKKIETNQKQFEEGDFLVNMLLNLIKTNPDWLLIFDRQADIPACADEIDIEICSEPIVFSFTHWLLLIAIFLNSDKFFKYLVEKRKITVLEHSIQILSEIVACDNLDLVKYVFAELIGIEKLRQLFEEEYVGIHKKLSFFMSLIIVKNQEILDYLVKNFGDLLDKEVIDRILEEAVKSFKVDFVKQFFNRFPVTKNVDEINFKSLFISAIIHAREDVENGNESPYQVHDMLKYFIDELGIKISSACLEKIKQKLLLDYAFNQEYRRHPKERDESKVMAKIEADLNYQYIKEHAVEYSSALKKQRT